jgi:hypothetical protein
MTMHRFYQIVFSIALMVPPLAFAQTVTRASVYADLVRVEEAGYRPNARRQTYPQDVQDAERRADALSGTSAAHEAVSQPDVSTIKRQNDN